ncbi:MAG TPA: zf-HC2 domain-containing protein [Blastocatellia bacterium]|nr:zf-HC2 domain-containing protein [Blastocatellia bacterium]
MNCERCQTELEDFLYGELGESRTAAVREHLTACADCRRVREELEQEHEIFSRFYEQTALEPSAEMWEVIRARIGDKSPAPEIQPARGSRLREWFAALGFGGLLTPALLRQAAFATVLVIVSVTATALYFSLSRDKSAGGERAGSDTPSPVNTPQPGPTNTPVSPPLSVVPPNDDQQANNRPRESEKKQRPAPATYKKESTPLPRRLNEDDLIQQQVARAAREYQNAIQLLEQKIARRKDTLNPTLLAQYEKSLELINSSIAASRRAMREQPNDPTAGQFLLAAYAKKVELMQEIAMQ